MKHPVTRLMNWPNALVVIYLCLTTQFLRAQDGVLDTSFAPPGKPYVHAIQKLKNGNILIGYCQAMAGGIITVDASGRVVPFSLKGAPLQIEYSGQQRYINDFIEQPDGKIIVVGGNSDPRITRHNSDGSLDSAFMKNIGKGPNLRLYQGVLEPNGKMTFIGEFTSWNDKTAGKIIRLNPDGTIDETFNCTGTTSVLGFSDIHLLPDGRYYLAGPNISVFDGQTASANFIRILPNGNVDTTMKAPQDFKPHKIGVQSDGRVVGYTPTQILRIFPDGKLDDSYQFINTQAGNKASTPEGLHMQKDDKFIVVGAMTKIKNVNVNNICRLNADGSFDASFATGPGASTNILTSQLTDDGSVLLGGMFFKYDGIDRSYVARLKNATGPRAPENLFTSISEAPLISDFTVFPVPAANTLFVQLPEGHVPAEYNVSFYDYLGQHLHTTPCVERETMITLPSDFPRGVVLCSVINSTTSKRFTRRIVVE